MYFSGVGSDPKQRYFQIVSQALRYDPSGAYVLKWIPELRSTRRRQVAAVGVCRGVVERPNCRTRYTTDMDRLRTTKDSW
mmetsp:Transcript_16385/g.29605  ORF Transcript_16385/g.29605 Transcript_16385/m.29605 type:complete len:80 (-) Transcript_16385:767-1006(-)